METSISIIKFFIFYLFYCYKFQINSIEDSSISDRSTKFDCIQLSPGSDSEDKITMESGSESKISYPAIEVSKVSNIFIDLIITVILSFYILIFGKIHKVR